jgi:tagatose 6-phosphate kinase
MIHMILVICLNPALQRTLWFNKFDHGEVNRASRKALSAGGKGVHVARIITALGENATLLTVLGGHAGESIKKYLERDHISYKAVSVNSETRNCTTILDCNSNKQTEVVEEGDRITKSESEAVVRAFQHLLKKSRFLVISGTALPGFAKTIYQKFVRMARQEGVQTLIDATGDLLKQSLRGNPFLVKPNWKEMETLVQEKIRNIKTMKESMKEIHREGADSVLVTTESSSAILFHEARFYRIDPPQVKVVNFIGSGDGVAAGISVGMVRGLSLIESIRLGIACGTANCKTPVAGVVRPNDVQSMVSKVRIEPL